MQGTGGKLFYKDQEICSILSWKISRFPDKEAVSFPIDDQSISFDGVYDPISARYTVNIITHVGGRVLRKKRLRKKQHKAMVDFLGKWR